MSTIVEYTPAQIAAAAERLPSTPQVYARLNAAMKDPDVGLDEIATIVRMDASLSARVIRLSNSPLFGRGTRVDNLSDAINRTGLDEIFRLVGAAMSSQLYVTGLPIYGIGGEELCNHSLATALALEHLAQRAGLDPRLGYTLGLMRSVGRLLLQRLGQQKLCPPMSGRKATGELVLAWERDTFGRCHHEFAQKLFEIWKFPDHFLAPIRFQYEPSNDPAQGRFPALLHLSIAIAEKLETALPVEKGCFSCDEALLAQAGVTAEDLQDCTDSARAGTAALALMLKAA